MNKGLHVRTLRHRARASVLVAPLLLTAGLVSAQDLCSGLVTDKLAHPMTALAKPAVGQAVKDPQFGATLRRVSAASSGGAIIPMYSTISAWNADESRLILYKVGSGHQLYDGKTYQFIRALDISPADIEQVYWHTSDPDVLFYLDGNRLIRYHVSTAVKDVLTTFSSCSSASGGSDPMYISWDAKRIGLECGSSRLIYDMSTNTIVGSKALSGDTPQVAPSGTLAFLGGKVVDTALNTVRTLDLGSPDEHASLGRTADGHDTYYGVAFDPGPAGSDVGSLVAHDMTTGAWRVIVGPATGYPYPPTGTHVSAMAYKRPGYVTLSIVGGTSGQGLLDQELVLADTNPGGKVCRVAHHRSWGGEGSVGYWAEPHAVPSPSGTRILFGSDWGNSGTVDAYVAELPAYTGGSGADGDLSVSLTPSAGSVAQGATVSYSATVLNGGSTSVPTVTLTDTLPAGLSFASATAGCTAAGQTVTCALGSLAGNASRTLTITATATAVGSFGNRVTVAGSVSDPNASNNSASVTTAVVPTLSINDTTLTEGNSGTKLAQLTVSLSAGSASAVTVNYATANGTAAAGSDYVAKTGTLSFSPGSLQATIAITINGDTTSEPNETFFVNLSGPVGALVADGQGVGTITNDDTTSGPTLSIADAAVTEGHSGTVNARFTVRLSAASSSVVTVNYATANGSAAAGSDYVAKSGTLSFPAGATSQPVDVAVVGDTTAEPNETFVVNLSAPSGASLADAQGVGTITNDDTASLPTLSIADATVTEGNSGTVNARFTVRLSAASGSAVTVNYATANGSAAAGSDYVARAGTLSFPAGTTSQLVDVAVNGETTAEPNETFVVNLSAPTGASLADAQGVGTITNDDTSSTVPTLTINRVAVAEGNSGTRIAPVVVSLSAPSASTVTVAYRTGSVTATAGSDFYATSGTLTFTPGTVQRTIGVTIVGDTRVEPDEYLVVWLSSPVGAILGSRYPGLVTIRNDD